MEARAATTETGGARRPVWLFVLLPLLLIGAALGVFALLNGPGLGDRSGPPVEELAVEHTVLHPGTIELSVRNDGPDDVTIAQAMVNDGFTDFTSSKRTLGHLDSAKVEMRYPWVEGGAYDVKLVTSTGATIDHEIPVAVETPEADVGFYGLMALLGFYVGIVPIALGMLWLPFVRRIDARWVRLLMALTIGLLGFLVIDATLEGIDVAAEGSQALGGTALVFLGGIVAYLLLSGVEAWLDERRGTESRGGAQMALLVAIAIGLHNLGEGLAIGAAYSTGAIALGTFLIIGFLLHNTTEGLGILAPIATERPSIGRLVMLGAIAGVPTVLGAWIGAFTYSPVWTTLFFAVGAGAIVQVVWELIKMFTRRSEGGLAVPLNAAGVMAGLLIMYVTGLLVPA
jgi:zinc transporter, ZIP family